MSLLYAHMTPKLFKTNKMNSQTKHVGLRIQQHIQQFIHFLMHLITQFERLFFALMSHKTSIVLRGAYPTSILDSVTPKHDQAIFMQF